MGDVSISAERFFERLGRLDTHINENRGTLYGGSDAVTFCLGTSSDDSVYSKSSAMHLYLFGYEFPDSIMVLTKGHFYFMATAKKNGILQKSLVAAQAASGSTIQLHFVEKTKDEGQNRENFHELLNAVRGAKGGGKKIGGVWKELEKAEGPFVGTWLGMVTDSQLDKIDVAPALGLFFSVKDDSEIEMCKRAAILTNKVMKHGFVEEMETILDKGLKTAHEKLSAKIDEVLLDPAGKLNLKIAADAVDSCYSPIVQSGGKYDIKVSATSGEGVLAADIILCSLGARYKGYCANMSRTYMVDVPPKVEKTYSQMLALYSVCLEKMIVGNELKDVYLAAKAHLTAKAPALAASLPKTLGFAMGLEFRDSSLVLNDKATAKFVPGMVFTLSVGLHNVPLSAEDKANHKGSCKNLEAFSLLLADTVRVQAGSAPDVLTKASKEYSDVSYNLGDEEEEDDDDDDDEDAMDEADGKKGKSKSKAAAEEDGNRRPKRNAEQLQAAEGAAAQRALKQAELMKKKIDTAIRKIESGGKEEAKEAQEEEVNELKVYNSTLEYPRDVNPTQLRVDLERECLLVPINGQPVPFHISTIKNVTMPEPDRATYLRINFYIPGSALGKEVNKNMAGLVVRHGDQRTFIKELTFRSLSQKNLALVLQQFQELRKRVRAREQKAEQEKDLVVQQKLIRIKDQRIPRLQDLTMRPSISGRKCVGTIEAHQNGLRFTSTKYEVLDVLYSNIKHAIYQPCDPTTGTSPSLCLLLLLLLLQLSLSPSLSLSSSPPLTLAPLCIAATAPDPQPW